MVLPVSVLWLVAVLLGGTDAARQLSKGAAQRVASTAGQPPGDVGAITGPVDDLLGSVGEDLAAAVGEVQDAATQASQPVIADPQSALTKAVDAAESTIQDLVPGRGLVTDVLTKSQATLVSTTEPVSRPTQAPKVRYAPAPFNGVFCRGAACMRRRETAAVKAGGEDSEEILSKKEFCRGLGCIPGSGHPPDPARGKFINACIHLFVDVGGGLQGKDESRTILDVRDSFSKVCQTQVDAHEAEFCRDYSDALVAALSVLVNEPTVGGTREVCASILNSVRMFKQAEVDLQLFEAEPPGGGNLSSGNVTAAFGDVEIVAASPDGVLPAVRVGSDLFSTCSKQMRRITKGQDQTAAKTVKMVKEWCALQTIITSWKDVRSKTGDVHPEWTAQSCLGMIQLVAFALREDMDGQNSLSATQVCKSLFLAVGAIHGLDRLADSGPALSTRSVKPMGLALPAGDPGMRRLAEEAKKSSEVVLARLQKQKEVAAALKSAKARVAAYSAQVALLSVNRTARTSLGTHPPAAA